MPQDTKLRDPERAIVEYLVRTSFLTDTARNVAALILAAHPLSESQRRIFQKQIADVWFHLDCLNCHKAICIEEIAAAIEFGHYRCGRCQQLNAGAKLLLAAGRMRHKQPALRDADAQLQKIRAAVIESRQRRRGRRTMRP